MAENFGNSTKIPLAGQQGLSGFWLKIIAVVTMFIDHTAATVLDRLLVQQPVWGPVTPQNYDTWFHFYLLLRAIGKMAFPIYCFLLVEGFYHTGSRGKYALRLFLFALISEVPFDMAFQQSFFDVSYNNVFFTLLIGLLTIWGADLVMTRIGTENPSEGKQPGKEDLRMILLAVVLFTGSALAALLCTDYSACGVIAIFIMYMFFQRRTLGFGLMVFELGLLGGMIEWAAFLMLIPIRYYNGTRGKQMKYFFYVFYPAHLLILSLLCYAMGLGI